MRDPWGKNDPPDPMELSAQEYEALEAKNKQLESENAALRKQVKEAREIIKLFTMITHGVLKNVTAKAEVWLEKTK